MKKAFALLLTLAMALGCLAGCGNGSASSAPAESVGAAAESTAPEAPKAETAALADSTQEGEPSAAEPADKGEFVPGGSQPASGRRRKPNLFCRAARLYVHVQCQQL